MLQVPAGLRAVRAEQVGGRRVAVSPTFARALDVALRAAEITDGDVDPTCGGSLVRLGYDKDFAELADDTSALTAAACARRPAGSAWTSTPTT